MNKGLTIKELFECCKKRFKKETERNIYRLQR